MALLGKGGGGEVWSVRDRVTGEPRALKVLAEDAGEGETQALVREAVTTSGLEGLGLPLVVAFGQLPRSGQRYLVRELVEGTSLEDVLRGDGEWLRPLASAADQLTALHRAGLLHGDVKPANVIVGPGGRGTLVDLGLAAPFREGGSRARGLTPRYAAPELLAGEPLTVRAEVYALGLTLADALAARGDTLSPETRRALEDVAARATTRAPAGRYPSVDELASALRSAARLATPAFDPSAAWPILGIEPTAQALAAEVLLLEEGEALALAGPPGSGRSTLLRRLAWSLGASGRPVVHLEGGTSRDLARVELAHAEGAFVLIDELDALALPPPRGARIVAVADPPRVPGARVFEVPPLDDASATELVRRAVPSLSERLTLHVLERTGRRPGALRAFVRRTEGRVLVAPEDVDAILDEKERGSLVPSSRVVARTQLETALETGLFDQAAATLASLGEPRSEEEAITLAVARARILLARGDAPGAAAALDAVPGRTRAWEIARARTYTRAGAYADAARLAEHAAEGDADATRADALSVLGVALAFVGDDERARTVLEEAVAEAQRLQHARIEAVALVSLAIAHQRGARAAEARRAYEGAIAAAERAADAWTLASARLNLAMLAKGEGDLALALVHLEGVIDLGQRAGGVVAVQQALLNLANLDLYLGRYARASASIEKLGAQKDALPPTARAQLLGLEAEHAARTGDVTRAGRLYTLSADAYDALARPFDAAEARLEGMLVAKDDAARSFAKLEAQLEGGFQEHEALAGLVRSELALARSDEAGARAALDAALERATRAGQREWAWRALDARAKLSASQGATALARRDTEAALAMLEEVAGKLPRDLREVFWNDPRRGALRHAHAASARRETAHTVSSHLAITSIGTPMPAEDRLSRIFEITRDLARERDLERLLERVVDHAIGLLGAERGLVVLADAAGAVVAHTVRGSRGEETHQNFSRSVAERVIREGEPVVATSARDDERLAQAVSVHQLMIQSIACVPIRGAPPAGATIGALYLETRLRPGLRFRDELPTLAAFADQAAIAIESARIQDELRRRSLELERVNAELAAARDKLSERLDARTEQLASARRDLKQARAELRGHFGYAGLVGISASMRKVYALIERIKDADVPVLVTGESGTGKEVIAKAIHASGARSRAPFLGVNCGAIPENLLESELFGHVRGAFTGADRDRKGLFREAQGGTLLLDEIGELPLKMQAGLLRTLQEKTVRPIGGAREEAIDVRIVAATNRDLAQMVTEGTFREDLFYRLHVIEVKVPPLRDRSDDIPALVDHFLGLFAARHKRERKSVERAAVRHLQAYEWPGNVRQLEHVLLNAWLLSEDDEIRMEDLDLPAPTSKRAPEPHEPSSVRVRTKDEHRDVEKEKILDALARSGWNRVQAAKLIGIPRRTFYRRLKDYGIV